MDIKNYLRDLQTHLIDECPKCKGYDLNCTCYSTYLLEQRKVVANIPFKFLNASPDVIVDNEYLEQKAGVVRYVKALPAKIQSGRGAFLWGGEGTAKSWLASYILSEAIKQGYSGYFITMGELATYLMDSRSHRGEDTDEGSTLIERIKKVQVLVIDDITFVYRPAKEQLPFTDFLMDNFLQYRINMGLPNIFTSQVNLANVKNGSIYGSRLEKIISSSMDIIACRGSSFRTKTGAKDGRKKSKA